MRVLLLCWYLSVYCIGFIVMLVFDCVLHDLYCIVDISLCIALVVPFCLYLIVYCIGCIVLLIFGCVAWVLCCMG